MEILGIKFAPLNIPIKRRIQTLIVGVGFVYMAFRGFLGIGITLFLIFYTNFWPITLLYLVWIWMFDKHVCEQGGRRVECVRGSVLWKYLRDYFPIHLTKTTDVQLDPKRNYLFCSFPHGVLATGAYTAFSTTAAGVHKLFPNHKPHVLTLKQNFSLPLFRDYLLSIGMCAASAKSINWLMESPRGGNIAILVVGGAAESFYRGPGQYHLVLKNRKGFVRLALQNGSPLVPMFSFGETDIFDQVNNPEGSILRSVQEWTKKITGIAPIIPLGRGFLQYSFGIVPMRKPMNIIVGKPIEVEKVENPTQEQIDIFHEKFIKQLTELFEEHKHKYIKNPMKPLLLLIKQWQ